MTGLEKIADILRAPKEVIFEVDQALTRASGHSNVLEELNEENERILRARLDLLGLGRNVSAKEVYDALISRIEFDDSQLFKALGEPSLKKTEDWQRILDVAREVAGNPTGLFIKKETAQGFLRSQPPLSVMKVLGYQTVEDLIQGENIFEIYAALRFIEGSEWLNNVFFKQYEMLRAEDFEVRPIEAIALSDRWLKFEAGFIKKKYHNISHLKEMGVIFSLPLVLSISGEVLRNFSLLLHYFNEISFYSSIFEKEKNKDDFANSLISLLKGISSDKKDFSEGKSGWLILPQYLAKEDENHWKLFVPHISPEAIHWEKAERILGSMGKTLWNIDFSFWSNLNWVGDKFRAEVGETLVSFNLVDTVMSLVKEKELIKYLYHHQEALWNRLFSSHFGEAELEKVCRDNLLKGWFEI